MDNISLSGAANGNQVSFANDLITAGSFSTATSDNVLLASGGEIRLQPGLTASSGSGSEFRTYLLGSNTTTSNAPVVTRQGQAYLGQVTSGTEQAAKSTKAEEATGALPRTFSLSQNYPNPFNPTTTIRYALPQGSRVTLKVYNVLGQEVATLVDGYQPAGFQLAVWDGRTMAGSTVPSGTYLYRVVAGDFVQTRTMVLLK